MGAGSLFGRDPRKQEEGSWIRRRQVTVAAVGSGGPCPRSEKNVDASCYCPQEGQEAGAGMRPGGLLPGCQHMA